ncbi:hypothetical protein BJX99DRAFT_94237 [Aspergillus californicus]
MVDVSDCSRLDLWAATTRRSPPSSTTTATGLSKPPHLNPNSINPVISHLRFPTLLNSHTRSAHQQFASSVVRARGGCCRCLLARSCLKLRPHFTLPPSVSLSIWALYIPLYLTRGSSLRRRLSASLSSTLFTYALLIVVRELHTTRPRLCLRSRSPRTPLIPPSFKIQVSGF